MFETQNQPLANRIGRNFNLRIKTHGGGGGVHKNMVGAEEGVRYLKPRIQPLANAILTSVQKLRKEEGGVYKTMVGAAR